MSGASERANGRASGPVLTYLFLFVADNSEAVARPPETAPLKARKLNGAVTKYYTRQEVLQHDQEDDCWLIVNGSVYNVTKWIPRHPG